MHGDNKVLHLLLRKSHHTRFEQSHSHPQWTNAIGHYFRNVSIWVTSRTWWRSLIEKSSFAKNRSMLHWNFHLMWIKWHRYHRKPIPTVLHHYRDPTPGKIGERIHYIVLWFKTKTHKDFIIFYFFVKLLFYTCFKSTTCNRPIPWPNQFSATK